MPPQERGPVSGAGPADRPAREGGPERAAETRPGPAREAPERQPPPRPDQFHQAGRLERFVRAIAERVEHGWLYQTFRLPGTSRIVHDRRGDGGAAADAPAARSQPFLSPFEQGLVKRFEQGGAAATASADGQPHFLWKTAAEWTQFFLAFLHRTQKKQVPLDAVAQDLTFRGLFRKGGDPARGVVIGDLHLADGTREKFARFDVLLEAVRADVRELQPGAALAKQVAARGVPGDQLEYLAIGPPTADAPNVVAMRDTQGVFTNLRTETEIARRLGLDKQEEAPAEEPPGQFIPWWQWAREERWGRRWWFTAVTLATIFTLLALGVWAVLRNFF